MGLISRVSSRTYRQKMPFKDVHEYQDNDHHFLAFTHKRHAYDTQKSREYQRSAPTDCIQAKACIFITPNELKLAIHSRFHTISDDAVASHREDDELLAVDVAAADCVKLFRNRDNFVCFIDKTASFVYSLAAPSSFRTVVEEKLVYKQLRYSADGSFVELVRQLLTYFDMNSDSLDLCITPHKLECNGQCMLKLFNLKPAKKVEFKTLHKAQTTQNQVKPDSPQ